MIDRTEFEQLERFVPAQQPRNLREQAYQRALAPTALPNRSIWSGSGADATPQPFKPLEGHLRQVDGQRKVLFVLVSKNL